MSKPKPSARLTPFSAHRIGVHMRVSSDPQDDESQAVDMRRAFAALGYEWPPAEYVFREKITGYRKRNFERRPELRRSVETIERGELRGIMFVNVSRVTRFTRDGEEWYSRMQDAGARVHFSEHPDIDLFTHRGREWFIDELNDAEKFSIRLSGRRKRGYAKSAARGEYLSSHPAFGCVRVDGIPQWTDDARIVRYCITRIYRDDLPAREVEAAAVRKFGKPVKARDIIRWCRNPIYFGLQRHVRMTYGRTFHTADELRAAEVVPARWAGLVPREWYFELDERIRARAYGGRGEHVRTRHAHHFGRGYLKCAHCGASMVGEMVDSKRGGVRVKVAAYTCGSRTCAAGRKAFPARELMRQLGEIVERIAPPAEFVDELVRRADERGQKRTARASGAGGYAKRRRDAALALAAKRITISQWQETTDAIDAEETAAVRVSSIAPRVDYSAIAERVATLARTWHPLSDAERAQTVRALFEAITVDAARKRLVAVRTDASIAAMLTAHPALRAHADGVTFDVLGAAGVEDAIRDAMTRLARPAAAREIAAAAGLGMDVVRPVVQRMAQMALIVRAGHRVEYRPHPKQVALWSLASEKPL